MEIIKASEFGLNEEKAIEIQNAFSPVIAEKEALTELYKPFLTAEITPELCTAAKELRLKLVKVRTSTNKIHKVEKAFFWAAGKFVDAWKNKNTVAVELMESELYEIENYYINIEKEKQQQKKAERLDILVIYDITEVPSNLGEMTDSAWYFYEKGIKEDYKQKIAAEKAEKEKRAAEEKAEKERIEKIESENIRLQKEAEKERAEAQRLASELKTKAKAEAKKEAEILSKIQAELQKGDYEKFEMLISDLKSLQIKYSFEAEIYKKKMSDAYVLIDKIIKHIE